MVDRIKYLNGAILNHAYGQNSTRVLYYSNCNHQYLFLTNFCRYSNQFVRHVKCNDFACVLDSVLKASRSCVMKLKMES